MRITGTGALVTGGASGLGAATVRRLAGAGAQVVIADLNAQAGEALAAELGDTARFVATDVTSEDSMRAAVQMAASLGNGLRILVNCAGIAIAEKVIGKDASHDLNRFAKVLQVNVVGAFNAIRLAAEAMQSNEPDAEGERGVIVNTASVAAFDGQIGQAAYSASKGGVVSMTLPIARELARYGIRVLSIAPGIFDTPDAGRAAGVRARVARSAGALPATAGPPGRIRRAGAVYRREHDAQRRDNPAGWRDPHGATLIRIPGFS